MVEGFRKNFRGGPRKDSADPHKWRVVAPKVGPPSARGDFTTPMNYALLHACCRFPNPRQRDRDDHRGEHETQWFYPQEPWRAGDYQLIVIPD